MCEPITAALTTTQMIMGGLSAASAAAGALAAAQSGQAQADAIAEQADTKADQLSDQAGVQIGERVKQGRAERARLRVAAGEAGVAGGSFEATLLQSSFDQSEDTATIKKDTELKQDANVASRNAALSQTRQPGALVTGLQIVGAGASGANAFRPAP